VNPNYSQAKKESLEMKTHFEPHADLDGAVVLVTGGTGSFGQQFIRTILARHNVNKLIVFSRDEYKQFEMQHDPRLANDPRLRFFLGDVRDLDRLRMAFRGVDYVIHAAAIKHIPSAEYNPFECIKTNVHGAENVVQAAIDVGVKKIIALSTDKAVSPVNLYGASKLASDKIFVAARSLATATGTKFGVVRYGNVIGSRGSVVPRFQQMIAEGCTTLPITDPRMTRFWITLQQGVDFVLSSLGQLQGGEIYVPKIPSMKIIDLAKSMAPDLEIDVIGIRPGEKLHEAMITEDDARWTVDAGDRYIIRSPIHDTTFDGLDQKSVPENFRYTSDQNTWWLQSDEMASLLTGSHQ
jgi:UDP-N-acetylglucosamine 4,6-dehydratase/5-epimerase